MLKFFILALMVKFSFATTSSQKAACLESGQTSPYIGAEYYTIEDVSYVTLTTFNLDGEVELEVLKGSDPDLSITFAETNEGEKITILKSITFDEETLESNIRVLVCSPAE